MCVQAGHPSEVTGRLCGLSEGLVWASKRGKAVVGRGSMFLAQDV